MRKIKTQALKKLAKQTEGGVTRQKYRLLKKRYNTLTRKQRAGI